MNNKGQFSLIAALLVAVILISTVVITYSTIRNSTVQNQPMIQAAVDETNFAIKQILGFTVGYYGSVLRVTGNTSYAKALAGNYLQSGLVNVAHIHAEWGASFDVSTSGMHTFWFTNASYSIGDLAIRYNLTGLGIYGVAYQTSAKLAVGIMNTTINQAWLNVTKDNGEPLINLGKRNFKFYRYQSSDSTWQLANPDTEPISYANGTYQIDLPLGVDPYSYVAQVEDQRGIIVIASSYSQYNLALNWTGPAPMINDSTVFELLQNGTLRWLGQNLQLTTQSKPFPPIPVKAIHINQTINGVSSEVPFQTEDWASDYRIPLGLTSNASMFSSRTMLVFLAGPRVSKVTIWWNGSDTSTQSPYAFTNRYFTGDDPSNARLTNGGLTLQIGSGFTVTATNGSSTSTANFMRINGEASVYGSSVAYVITGGVVRDIIHQEAEWNNGAYNCPNIYAHAVLTLPANATYYTYQLRLMFMQSQQSRTLTNLCPIYVRTTSSSVFTATTENGTAGGYPLASSSTGLFYNSSSSYWAHHWSQFNSTSTKGFGIMFTDNSNEKLYYFDAIAGSKTGGLNVSSSTNEKRIEILPVALTQVSGFTAALDITWTGAVVTYDNATPIYRLDNGNPIGLWAMVEYPPNVRVTTQS